MLHFRKLLSLCESAKAGAEMREDLMLMRDTSLRDSQKRTFVVRCVSDSQTREHEDDCRSRYVSSPTENGKY